MPLKPEEAYILAQKLAPFIPRGTFGAEQLNDTYGVDVGAVGETPGPSGFAGNGGPEPGMESTSRALAGSGPMYQFDSPESRAGVRAMPPAVRQAPEETPKKKRGKLDLIRDIANILAGAAIGAQLGPAGASEFFNRRKVQDQQFTRQQQIDEQNRQQHELQLQQQRLAMDPQYQSSLRQTAEQQQLGFLEKQARLRAQLEGEERGHAAEFLPTDQRDFYRATGQIPKPSLNTIEEAIVNARTPEERAQWIEAKKQIMPERQIQPSMHATDQGMVWAQPDTQQITPALNPQGKPYMPFRNPPVQINYGGKFDEVKKTLEEAGFDPESAARGAAGAIGASAAVEKPKELTPADITRIQNNAKATAIQRLREKFPADRYPKIQMALDPKYLQMAPPEVQQEYMQLYEQALPEEEAKLRQQTGRLGSQSRTSSSSTTTPTTKAGTTSTSTTTTSTVPKKTKEQKQKEDAIINWLRQ